MGKALQVYGPGPLGVDTFLPLGGVGHWQADEFRSQFKLSEGATFSGLSWRATGASGTNTMRFRKNSANGNQVATRSGPGFAADTTNSDVCVDNDLVNYSWTDTGTDPAIIFVRSNVEFASGHGNFHICANASTPVNLNFSSTRYFPLSGTLLTPQITIANAQWKNRGNTSFEAFQVVILANARANSTTFRANVNGVNVGATLTIAAGITGLHEVTGLGITLNDGDLVCIQWSSGAGSQNFLMNLIGATFKSSSGSSETWGARLLSAGYTRTASATPSYLKIGGNLEQVATESEARIKIGFACRARNLRTFIEENSCTSSQTLKLFINGTGVLTRTIAAGATGWQENETDTFDLNDTDEACLEIVGGTSGSCLFRNMGLTFSPIPAAGGGIVRQMMQYYQEAA